MKNKHLTLQDRQSIEQMLNAKKTFAEIARTLEKDKCTISKEVRAHVERFRIGGQGYNYNNCKNRYHCQKTQVCSSCNSPKKFKLCRRCTLCNLHCPDLRKTSVPVTLNRHTSAMAVENVRSAPWRKKSISATMPMRNTERCCANRGRVSPTQRRNFCVLTG